MTAPYNPLKAIFPNLPIQENLGKQATTAVNIGQLLVNLDEIKQLLIDDEKAFDRVVKVFNQSLAPKRQQFYSYYNQLPESSKVRMKTKLAEKIKQLEGLDTMAKLRQDYLSWYGNDKPSRNQYDNYLTTYRERAITQLLPPELKKEKVPIYFPMEARERNAIFIGAAGSGKSNLLALLMYLDMNQKDKTSCVLLEGHGDLCLDVLQFNIPNEKIIYLSPEFGEEGVFFKYNPLHHRYHDAPKHQKIALITNRAEELLSAFERLMGSTFSPPMERLLYNCLLLLLFNKGMKLKDLLYLLRPKQSEKYLALAENHPIESVRFYFQDDFHLKNMAITKTAVITRLEAVFSNYYVQNIFDAEESSFDLRKEIESNKLLIINASQGVMGEQGARLFGALILSEIVTIGLQRQKQQPEERVRTFVTIDEAHNFLTNRMSKALAELRKYKIIFQMACQYLTQISSFSTNLRDAVLANTQVKGFASTNAKDFATLSREVGFHTTQMPKLKHGKFVFKVLDYDAVTVQVYGDLMGKKPPYFISPQQLKKRIEYQKKKYYRSVLEDEKKQEQENRKPKKPTFNNLV